MMRRGILLARILGICVYAWMVSTWSVSTRCAPQAATEVVGVAPAAQAEPKKAESKNAADWMVGVSPARKPADAPAEMKELVGLYRNGEKQIILLETGQMLNMEIWADAAHTTSPRPRFTLESRPDGNWKAMFSAKYGIDVTVERNVGGRVVALNFSNGVGRFVRADAGADPKNFYRVTPVKPLEQLRAEAKATKPPVEKGPFRKPELVELTNLDPEFHLDIRYANSNNFLSTPVYSEARAFMQRPAAEALERVTQKLKPMGYGLLIHDAYRPWYVTKIFWDATPVEGHIFVADPQKGSKHNRGCAVDLTMYDLATGAAVEMPGLYDEMSERSFPDFPGGTWRQRWQRDLLRKAMESVGFTVDEHEWWHFDYKDWKKYSILNVGFEEVGGKR